MDMQQIDAKLERIEAKLDTHLEKAIRNEEAIASIRGHIKVIASVGLAVISAFLTAIFRQMTGGK